MTRQYPQISPARLRHLMNEVLILATKTPRSTPRPLVGALVINDETGQIIGKGQKRNGKGWKDNTKIHAERAAINNAQTKLSPGGLYTMVTTLEPCIPICYNHGRKTFLSSCSDLIADVGIGRVVYGLRDFESSHFQPGEGIEYLRQQRINGKPIEVLGIEDIFSREDYLAYSGRLQKLLKDKS